MKKLSGIFWPVVSLVIFSVLITSLMSAVFHGTSDQIAQQEAKSRAAAMATVLPEAAGFSEEAATVNGEEVVYYRADNGAGVVIVTTGYGYGGPIVLLVGIDNEGVITGIAVTSQNETPGLGSRDTDPDFLEQFYMPVPEGGFVLVTSGADEAGEIEALSGATISSRAVTDGVNEALAIYEVIK